MDKNPWELWLYVYKTESTMQKNGRIRTQEYIRTEAELKGCGITHLESYVVENVQWNKYLVTTRAFDALMKKHYNLKFED